MARSSSSDPIEKFRFRVSVISIDLSVEGAFETVTGLLPGAEKVRLLSRAGFSEITLPKATVNEMNYRENIDNQRFSKGPGLVRYDPITLRRGVTDNRNLYDWYRLVNEEIALLSVAQELNQEARVMPQQNESFRRDVIIEVLDRQGEPVKAWYLFNAFPTGYTPGDSLNASSDEKLIEDITLTYEFFLELEGGLDGFAKEIAKGALIGVAGAALGPINNFITKKLPFLR